MAQIYLRNLNCFLTARKQLPLLLLAVVVVAVQSADYTRILFA